MLAKKSRIPRKLFGEILQSRDFRNSPHFSVRIAQGGGVRIAVSVSKKVSKSAVIRNRTRRRAYSVIRGFANSLKSGLYLVMAKPGAEKLQGTGLENELRKLLL